MNIYWLKINSVHLSIAKCICPNSWVFDFEYLFWKSSIMVFPFKAYVSHRNDGSNLTLKVLLSIKGLVAILSIFFL